MNHKKQIIAPEKSSPAEIMLTAGGQRRYYIDGAYKRYMSAKEVSQTIKDEGFRGMPVCIDIYRKLARRDPLTESQVSLINRFLEGKLKD